MLQDYDARSNAIQRCLDLQRANIKTLREKQADNKDAPISRQNLNDVALMVGLGQV